MHRLTDEQLLLQAIDDHINYCERKRLQQTKSSDYVIWKCFQCSKFIRVHYKSKNLKNLFCSDCRPKILRKNGILFRYAIMYKNHVGSLLIKNSNIKL